MSLFNFCYLTFDAFHYILLQAFCSYGFSVSVDASGMSLCSRIFVLVSKVSDFECVVNMRFYLMNTELLH